MKKLLLSLLFALVALTGLQAQTIWDGTADTSWYNETSTEFEISTAKQLAGLAELVNNGNYFGDKTILLTADIVLNDTSDWENWEYSASANTWTPIGLDWGIEFYGTFDGQGHTVSGVYINTENPNQGLFGINSGTIKNVGVTESYIRGSESVGGMCGYNSGGTISNCYNYGTVSGNRYVGGVCGDNSGTISNCYNSGTVHGNGNIGGVCGYNPDGIISNCYNSGTVRGFDYIGGVCGYNHYAISNCYNTGTVSGIERVGGVCGYNDYSTISNCYNSGTVTGDYKVGGVCGSNESTKSTQNTLANCYNSGIVTGGYKVGGVCGYNDRRISNCYNTGAVSGNDVGGVCGYNNSDYGTISNCYNSGTINGNDQIGGICGHNYGTISNCYNSGTVSGDWHVGGVCGYNYGSISDCYNSGKVNGSYYVGGVCGQSYYGTISNCYYLEGTADGGIYGSSDKSGQAEVKTTEQFASGEVCWLLNEEQSEGAWGQKLGTDPCPVLGGPAVFKDGETYYNEEGSAIIETNSEQASFVIVSENLTIKIYGSDGEATVYNLAGIVVYQGIERIIPVQNPGIYMVRIGNEVQKTIVR